MVSNDAPKMRNLRQLRFTVRRKSKDEQYWTGGAMLLEFGPDKTPGLEVLELDVEANMEFFIDPVLPLQTLVLVTNN